MEIGMTAATWQVSGSNRWCASLVWGGVVVCNRNGYSVSFCGDSEVEVILLLEDEMKTKLVWERWK